MATGYINPRPAAKADSPVVSKPADDRPRMDLPMSKIGKPQRTIEIEPIEEPAAEPVKVPKPVKVPERV